MNWDICKIKNKKSKAERRILSILYLFKATSRCSCLHLCCNVLTVSSVICYPALSISLLHSQHLQILFMIQYKETEPKRDIERTKKYLWRVFHLNFFFIAFGHKYLPLFLDFRVLFAHFCMKTLSTGCRHWSYASLCRRGLSIFTLTSMDMVGVCILSGCAYCVIWLFWLGS